MTTSVPDILFVFCYELQICNLMFLGEEGIIFKISISLIDLINNSKKKPYNMLQNTIVIHRNILIRYICAPNIVIGLLWNVAATLQAT